MKDEKAASAAAAAAEEHEEAAPAAAPEDDRAPARRSDPRPEKSAKSEDKPEPRGRVPFGDTDQVPAFLLRSAFPNGADAHQTDSPGAGGV